MSDDSYPIIDNESEKDAVGSNSLGMESASGDPFQDTNVLKMTVFVEGGLAVLALAFGYFGFYDRSQPLVSLGTEAWMTGAIWGSLGTIPLLAYLAVFHFYPPKIFQPMKEFVEEQLKPLFSRLSLWELAFVSIMAGFCEELFFRWCLQGGIASTLDTTAGTLLALVSISILFGLCHWVNSSYGITTIVVGLYLGALMLVTGSFLAPAIAHTLFDFFALIYISRYLTTAH